MTRKERLLTQAHKERSVSEELAFQRGATWADEHPNWSSIPTKFKAECAKADPLRTLEVGKIYDCISWNGKVIVGDGSLALADNVFNELFKKL